jgi:hypothetical protein
METTKILDLFDNLIQILNKIKLDKTSAELYELIDTINICKDIVLQTQNISQNKFLELVQIINKQIEFFLNDVNNNQEIKEIIDQSFYMKIDEFYKTKYLKYKKKYIQLKNQ